MAIDMLFEASAVPPLDPATWIFLLAAAFAAGFIDAVAGGGGLISTPALLVALPQAPVAAILATTKCSLALIVRLAWSLLAWPSS